MRSTPLLSLEPDPALRSRGLELVGRNCLRLNGADQALITGEVQFFRMDPSTWAGALKRMTELGIQIVSSYIGWRRFSLGPNQYDLTGQSNPSLNIPAFLELCQRMDLWVVLKPGPWMCAEDTNGGYPDWLVSIPELQVLDATGQVVQGYNPPFQSPVPSYLHPTYQGYVANWLKQVDEVIGPYCYPNGPVIMVQLDNEPCYTFHDRLLESDYNLVNIAPGGFFQQWLRNKYGEIAALNRQYGLALTSFDAVQPPRQKEIHSSQDLRRYLDWVDFKEWTLARHVSSIGECHLRNGLDRVLFSVNYNEHPQLAVPNNWKLLELASGVGGFDFYPRLPMQFPDFVRKVQAVNYSLQVNRLPWSPEMMSGIWSFEGDEHQAGEIPSSEYEYLYLVCLAFGLKGMNFYMLADRDHWVHSPIDAQGNLTETADSVRAVKRLFEQVHQFPRLQKTRFAGILYHHRDAQEAFVAEQDTIWVDGYRLGSAYEQFSRLYTILLELNVDPAIIDLSANPDGINDVSILFAIESPNWDAATRNTLAKFTRTGGEVVRLCGLEESLEKGQSPGSLHFGDAPGVSRWGCSLEDGEIANKVIALLAARPELPWIRSSNPRIMAIEHRHAAEKVLFILNADDEDQTAILSWRHTAPQEFEEILSGAPCLAQNGEWRVSLPPRTVGVYRLVQKT